MSIPPCPIAILTDTGTISIDRNYNNNELFDAVKNNDLETAKNLIVYKWMNVNEKNGAGETLIFYAVYNNNLEMVKLLVDHNADINVKTYYGKPLLLNCLRNNNNDIVRFLIEKGADVNIEDNGKTLLYWCIGKNQELLDLLLEKKDLNVNIQQGDFGTTPLFISIRYGDINIVEKLIKLGADVNLKLFNGFSPLSEARRCGNNEIIKLLLENNALDEK